MAKVSSSAKVVAILMMLIIIMCVANLQGGHGIHDDPSAGSGSKVDKDVHRVTTPCGHGVYCTMEYFESTSSTCKTSNGSAITLPAFSNCCILHSCVPRNYTECALQLGSDENLPCPI